MIRVYLPPGEKPAAAEEESVTKEDDLEPAVPAAADDAAVTVEEAVTTPDETSPASPAEDVAAPAVDSAESMDAGELDCWKR